MDFHVVQLEVAAGLAGRVASPAGRVASPAGRAANPTEVAANPAVEEPKRVCAERLLAEPTRVFGSAGVVNPAEVVADHLEEAGVVAITMHLLGVASAKVASPGVEVADLVDRSNI